MHFAEQLCPQHHLNKGSMVLPDSELQSFAEFEKVILLLQPLFHLSLSRLLLEKGMVEYLPQHWVFFCCPNYHFFSKLIP